MEDFCVQAFEESQEIRKPHLTSFSILGILCGMEASSLTSQKPYPGPISDEEEKSLEGNGLVLEDTESNLNRVRSAWGDSRIVLTPSILEKLKSGGVWIHSDGEYTTEIRLGDEG